jgi:para-nitrobenzyl esterase
MQPTRRAIVTTGMYAGIACAVPAAARATPSSRTANVDTAAGKVCGTRSEGVSAFRGIPYGGDTVTRRFLPPLPAKPWKGVRDCIDFGPRAPQGDTGGSGRIPPGADRERVMAIAGAFREGQVGQGNESEDCLYLNVYTPDASHVKRRRPVMFWLHGGGFAIGSGGERVYVGDALCRRGDVVVVTINHRLAAPGYLYLGDLHPDFADSGNVGQLDQILALQWVRDNIAGFGGDPMNVTIFGESGGGAKVSSLLAMPPAHGLFHKAIVQSGPGLRMVERADAAAFAEAVMAAMSIPKPDVHKLQSMELATVMKAAADVSKNQPPGKKSLAPVVDGRSLPAHPFDPVAPAISRTVPLIVGSTRDEATLFSIGDPLFGKMTPDDARSRFASTLGGQADEAFRFYREQHPDDAPTYWVTSMLTDKGTWMDSIRLAERQIQGGRAPVYMYRVDWRTPVFDGTLRSPHGIDTPLVFDNAEQFPKVLGQGPELRILAAAMSQAWVDFARTGNPSHSKLSWPAYDTTARSTMIFDVSSRAVNDPDRAIREFWS